MEYQNQITFCDPDKDELYLVTEDYCPEELADMLHDLDLVVPAKDTVPGTDVEMCNVVYESGTIFHPLPGYRYVKFFDLYGELLLELRFPLGVNSYDPKPGAKRFIEIVESNMSRYINNVASFGYPKCSTGSHQIDLDTQFDGIRWSSNKLKVLSPDRWVPDYFFAPDVVKELNAWTSYLNRSEPVVFWDNKKRDVLLPTSTTGTNLEYWKANLTDIMYVSPSRKTSCYRMSNVSMATSWCNSQLFFYAEAGDSPTFQLNLESKHFDWFFKVALFVFRYFVSDTGTLYFGGQEVKGHLIWSHYPYDPVILKPLVHPTNYITINGQRIELDFGEKILNQVHRTIAVKKGENDYPQVFDPKDKDNIAEFRVFYNIDFRSFSHRNSEWINLSLLKNKRYIYDIEHTNDTSETLIRITESGWNQNQGFVPYNPDFIAFLESVGITKLNANQVIQIIDSKGKLSKYTKGSNYWCFSLDGSNWVSHGNFAGYEHNVVDNKITLFQYDKNSYTRVMEFSLNYDENQSFFDQEVKNVVKRFFTADEEPQIMEGKPLRIKYDYRELSFEDYLKQNGVTSLSQIGNLFYNLYDPTTMKTIPSPTSDKIKTLHLLTQPTMLMGACLVGTNHNFTTDCPDDFGWYRDLLGDKFVEPLPFFHGYGFSNSKFISYSGTVSKPLEALLPHFEKVSVSNIMVESISHNQSNVRVWIKLEDGKTVGCYIPRGTASQILEQNQNSAQNQVLSILKIMNPTSITLCGKDSIFVIGQSGQNLMIPNIPFSFNSLKQFFPSAKYFDNLREC